MHQLVLKNVGPIQDCQIDIKQFNVFTGAQASGKSTVAKSVFFFRTVKEDICDFVNSVKLNSERKICFAYPPMVEAAVNLRTLSDNAV